MKTNRRNFLKKGSIALGSAALLNTIPLDIFAAAPAAKKRSFGFQVWTIRKELIADFAGTLEKMAAMGYKEVEMCSPLGYSGAGFEPLNQVKNNEMRKIIDASGLRCTSSHFNLGELRDSLENRIEWAAAMGMKQMVAASFWLGKDATMDDYRKAARELNEIGAKTRAAGMRMVFHNHHMEFEKLDGKLIYDVLLEEFDPDLVKMQFQVAVFNIGYKAADYFRAYPGRFISAHLADWSAQKDSQVPIGQGDVDWDDFFKASKKGGVENFYVEMAPETFAPSADFLKNK